MKHIKPILATLMHRKLIALLMVLQVAVTLAICSNALSTIQNTLSVMSRDTGFPPQQIFSFSTSDSDLAPPPLPQSILDTETLRQINGVVDATLVLHAPFSEFGASANFYTKDTRVLSGMYFGDQHTVTAFGLELTAGRDFRADEVNAGRDGEPSPVAIVTQAFAQALFPAEQALGQHFYFDDDMKFPITIVGIVRNMQFNNPLADYAENNLIFPQRTKLSRSFVVRTEPGRRDEVMAIFGDRLMQAYDGRTIDDVRTLEERLAQRYEVQQSHMEMLEILTLLLFMVMVLSLMGITSNSLDQRRRQIGTYRALGARKADILQYFLTENLLLGLAGIGLGSILSVMLNHWILNHYDAPRLGGFDILATALFLLLVALLSVFYPALKASRVSPAIATRSV